MHLVISGGEHGNVYSLRTYSGDVDLGPTAPIHVGTEMMKWFDQHVKGKDRGVKPGNLIRAFRIEGGDGVMNAVGRLQAGGTWQEFTEWPPADSSPVSYYLGADRSLTSVTPATGSITYAHDPAISHVSTARTAMLNSMPLVCGLSKKLLRSSGGHS